VFDSHPWRILAQPARSSTGSPPADPDARRLRRSWRFLAGSFGLLGAVGVAEVVVEPGQSIGLVVLTLIAVTTAAALVHQRAVAALAASQRAEAEHLARILQGLSRSASPDAIVDAIVADLGVGTGADHMVVIRLRPEERFLEATLFSARPGVPSATTRLPLSDLDGLGAAGRDLVAVPIVTSGTVASESPARAARGARVAARIPTEGTVIAAPSLPLPAGLAVTRPSVATADPVTARLEARAREEFGLSNTIAAGLRTDHGTIGAIVLARRTEASWTSGSRRILQGAAMEAAAALGRAESHRSAEVHASTDALTGLPNRRYFDEFCGLLARRRRADDVVGVLMVDIDNFKRVNDAHGHEVGDEVLRAVAGAIAGAVRDGDVPARIGGEEFAVLLRNPSERMAVEVGERVRAAVGALDLRGIGAAGLAGVSVSVGVAVAVGPDEPMTELLAEADRALYRAKRAGRDRVVAA
jgi:diguanylate cyclase (GGDEF)-like protein